MAEEPVLQSCMIVQEKATSPRADKEPRMIVTLTMQAWPQQPTHITQDKNDTENQEK